MEVKEFILIVFGVHLAVSNIKVFNVATKMQHWFAFALLSSYKIFCTAVNNIRVFRSSCKGPDTSG
jgi:hypothetical protein